ncbi:hypothetical protein BGZ97_011498 [Linnemannia gamsii]|uniref:Arrestin-like N-terminal domain-containing protein n=1 Tax=Linnemannia gamsii TaxID=64522 RepID=A0A9P6UN02_9FUNG|nr:hypothetical protein BGZ97_011498 [Linnemannia gamsii]
MAILDYSKDASKSIAIRFHTQEHGPMGQPLFYHTPEEPAVIRGYVEFTTIRETKASDITLAFEARAESKWTEEHGGSHISYHHIIRLQEQTWDVKLNRTNKTITPGMTRYEFEVKLDPELPPTIEGRRGWFHYRFKAHMQRDFPFRNMAVKQLVWVYSSSIREMEVQVPKIYKELWNDILPVTCTLPSDTLYQGQVVPLTIRIDPFLENSIHKDQELIVTSALVKMKQYTTLREPRMLNKKRKEKKIVFILPVMEGWPITRQGFERTVMIELPDARKLAASIETVPVTKAHLLKLIMMVRAGNMEEKEAKELRVEMDVRITSPRPEHIRGTVPVYPSLPPPYEASSSDDEDDGTPPEFSRAGTTQSEYQSDIKEPISP